jgi:hypothetical protein
LIGESGKKKVCAYEEDEELGQMEMEVEVKD